MMPLKMSVTVVIHSVQYFYHENSIQSSC